MPMAVRPRPIRAPAVMMAPHNARMTNPPELEAERILEEAQEAAADQQDPGQDDQHAAAAAARPGAVGTARAPVAVPPKEPPAPHWPAETHGLLLPHSRLQGSRTT